MAHAITPMKRRRRFKPSPEESLAFAPSDLEILRTVADHDIIDSRALRQLLDRGDQGILRRLRELFDHDYLRRPLKQIERYRDGGGSSPMVYTLGNRGILELEQRLNYRRSKIDWTARARTLKRGFIDHTLGITEFMVRLELTCRDRGHLRIVHLEEILQTAAPAATRSNVRAYQWAVPVEWNSLRKEITLTPDRIFAIEDKNRPAGANRRFFFLEVDRGTEPADTDNLLRTSIRKKLAAYSQTHGRKLHQSVYGMNSFRVLFVVDGTREGRIKSITDTYRKRRLDLTGAGLFLFAAERELRTAKDVLVAPWVNAEGQPISLLL